MSKIQDKVMDARFALQFKDKATAVLGLAAASYQIVAGTVATIDIVGNQIIYDADWANTTSKADIETAIATLVKANASAETLTAIENRLNIAS